MSPDCNYCTRPAVVEVRGLGMPEATATMLLCTRHFWDWNAKSLKHRGLRAGDVLQVHVDAGVLDDPPVPVCATCNDERYVVGDESEFLSLQCPDCNAPDDLSGYVAMLHPSLESEIPKGHPDLQGLHIVWDPSRAPDKGLLTTAHEARKVGLIP